MTSYEQEKQSILDDTAYMKLASRAYEWDEDMTDRVQEIAMEGIEARKTLTALVAELRALHRESTTDWTGREMNHPICFHCEGHWPCDTAAGLDRHAPEEKS